MTANEKLTLQQLKEKGQVEYYPLPPRYKITPCYRTKCGPPLENTYDYEIHKKHCKGKQTPRLTQKSLDTLPWKPFRNNNGEWIFSNQAPHLLEAICNGHTQIGDHQYWTSQDNRFIGRRKTQTF